MTHAAPNKKSAAPAAKAHTASKAAAGHLRIGEPNDAFEQEADRVADRITAGGRGKLDWSLSRMQPGTPLQRTCSCGGSGQCEECGEKVLQRACEECYEDKLQPKSVSPSTNAPHPATAPAIVHDVLRSPGRPLDSGACGFMESRFGHDFSKVRVHTDTRAAESARAVNAHAYTVGNNVVFGNGRYAPETRDGQHLLAHELTHVVQQSPEAYTQADNAAIQRQVLQRDWFDDLKKRAEDKAKEFAKDQLGPLATAPAGPPSGFTGEPKCGPTYCQPFADKGKAVKDLGGWAGPLLLAGIGKTVSPRVIPLWRSYLYGGSPPQDISADFAKDFTASPTTAATTKYLVEELRKDIEANSAALLAGASSNPIDFTGRLQQALARIDEPKEASPPKMEFVGNDVPGNLAGGIGKDETTYRIGAQPSPFNDSRKAVIKADLTPNPDGSLKVTPVISYTVCDTIDFCPGNCGPPDALVATIPMSRFEATGLSGDVPFVVKFDAPASELAPFDVMPVAPVPTPKPPPKPEPVFPQSGPAKMTGSLVRIRTGPGLKFPALGELGAKGTSIQVITQVHGDVVLGNDKWDKISRGYVSDAYVEFDSAASPKTP